MKALLLATASLAVTLPVFAAPAASETEIAAASAEEVIVTATRSERSLADIPVSAQLVTETEIKSTPAFALDDVLRTVPAVNLPNAASYQLHPTSNSVSMRGLGGARALVLLDGVPLNDGLFGYVQWSRVPLENVERAEVVRGGGATLWGNYAMGGVINIITRAPDRTQFIGELGYGSQNTLRVNGYGAFVPTEKFKLSANIGYAKTDGYNQVRDNLRAPLFIPTSFEAMNVTLAATAAFDPTLTGTFRVSRQTNDQVLGTPLSKNHQWNWDYSGSLTKTLGESTALTATAFHSDSRFRTDNTGTPAGFANGYAEFVQNRHVTPVHDTGASLQLTSRIAAWMPLVLIGGDYRIIEGTDTAGIFDETLVQIRTDVGEGKQRFVGAFAQASIQPLHGLEVLLSARYEWIANFDGFDGNPGGLGRVPDSHASSFDPRVSVRYQVIPHLALRAAAYKAFRAPTLDNLYRAFSVPEGIFYPNAVLSPEKLKGAEVGFDVNFDSVRLAVTAYTNKITNLITSRNLDFSELPSGFFFGSRNINAGSARARGIEAEADWHITPALDAALGYAFAESVITDNPQDPVSVGKQLASVPRHQASLRLSYTAPAGWRVSTRARWLAKSYGDNDHTLPVDSQFVVDASAAYPIAKGTELFVNVQNLLDSRYVADNSGFNPPYLGTPLSVFGGIRIALS